MADNKRCYNFCLMTYLNEQQIKTVLSGHDRQLKAYAYICHDKDKDENGNLKQVHTHILLSLVNATTCNAVRNWFKGYTDEKGMPINTLAQPMHDISCSFEYLTHNTEQAKADGKHIYDDTSVKGFNIEYFKDSTLQEVDNLTLALQDLMDGIPLIDVAKRYGRDFIVHYGHIKMLFNDIQTQIGGRQL